MSIELQMKVRASAPDVDKLFQFYLCKGFVPQCDFSHVKLFFSILGSF